MATGNYGVVRPATVTPNDMEVFFTYSPSRDTAPTIPIQRLVANQIITTFKHPTPNNGNIPLFDGLYNLQLPLANFSAKGILQLKGKDVPIILNFNLKAITERFAHALGTVALKRSDFNIGDKNINKSNGVLDEVLVNFEIQEKIN